jgi:hypothetical protein
MVIHPAPIIPADRRIWHFNRQCGRPPHQVGVGWVADGKVRHWSPRYAFTSALEARWEREGLRLQGGRKVTP